MTAHVSFYTRQATIVVSRSNYSIVSVLETTVRGAMIVSCILLLWLFSSILTIGVHHDVYFHTLQPPEPVTDFNVTAYRVALAWLLNFTAADIPGPSSISQTFWSAASQLADGPAYYGVLEQNLQSILAFPFYLFNVNNYGNPSSWVASSNDTATMMMTPGSMMPPQFYTTASLVAPRHVYVLDRAMYAGFLVLQGVALVLLWVVFGVVLFGRGQLPEVSAFPLFDIKYKARVVDEEGGKGDQALAEVDVNKVIEVMKDAVVVSTARRKRAETM